MAAALAFDLRVLAHSRADGQWPFDLGVGIALAVAALLRARLPTASAAVGLAVFAAAALAAGHWRLWPVSLFGAALVALVVLAASSARTLTPRRAIASAPSA